MHQVKRAVIMAAGEGRRLRPVTYETPKPLIPVNGVRMIDTAIRALNANGISEIHVVVGYLKDRYAALPEQYPGLTLVENPYYDTCNNISSAFVARAFLSDAILMEADFLLHNPRMLRPAFARSCYCALPVARPNPNEWMLSLDGAGRIISCATDGSAGTHQLFGVSFWTAQDGARLQSHLEQAFLTEGRRDVYWDTLPLMRFYDEYALGVREIGANDIQEIDTLDDLIATDPTYVRYGAKTAKKVRGE